MPTTWVKPNKGKYDIDYTTYPSDLLTNNAFPYGGGWVMFNINVQKNSKIATTGQVIDLSADEKAKQDAVQTEKRATNMSAGATYTGVTVAGAGLGAAGGLASAFSLEGVMNAKTRGATAARMGAAAGKGALVGGVTAAALNSPYLLAGTATRETKRIKTAINLPMPNQLQTNYSTEWGSGDTWLADLMARGGTLDATTNTSMRSAGAALALQLGKDIAPSVSAATGLAANSKKEMIFQGVNFRTLTLRYLLYPRNDYDQNNIFEIIKKFKYHMHPEFLADDRFTFVYPSEFDITFFHGEGENQWIFRFGTSILQDVSVNYTPDGLWAQHNGGEPNAVELSLTFKELGILTKDSIDKDF